MQFPASLGARHVALAVLSTVASVSCRTSVRPVFSAAQVAPVVTSANPLRSSVAEVVADREIRARRPEWGRVVPAGVTTFRLPFARSDRPLRVCRDAAMTNGCVTFAAGQRRVTLAVGTWWWSVIGSALAPQLLCIAPHPDAAALVGMGDGCGTDGLAMTFVGFHRVDALDPALRSIHAWDNQQERDRDLDWSPSPPQFMTPNRSRVALFRIREAPSFAMLTGVGARSEIRRSSLLNSEWASAVVPIGDVVEDSGEDVLLFGRDSAGAWRASIVAKIDADPVVFPVQVQLSQRFQPTEAAVWMDDLSPRELARLLVGLREGSGGRIALLRVTDNAIIEPVGEPVSDAGLGPDWGLSMAPVCDIDGDGVREVAAVSQDAAMQRTLLTILTVRGDAIRVVRTVELPARHWVPQLVATNGALGRCVLFVHSDRLAGNDTEDVLPISMSNRNPSPADALAQYSTTTRCFLSASGVDCSVVHEFHHGNSRQYRSWLSIVDDPTTRAGSLVIGAFSDSVQSSARFAGFPIGADSMQWTERFGETDAVSPW
jgi:hypothetical protein